LSTVAKRDEDSQSDMEVGMTTAERRRRRRRGGSLRVPSDNVPRTRAPTSPPPPRPEDPSLAMSIAYSFGNDSSSPIPRMVDEFDSGPIAPDGASTVIDPPAVSPPPHDGGSVDFETKTREMSAVDLDALGLSDPSSTLRMERLSSPGMEMPATPVVKRPPSDNDVEINVDSDVVDTQEQLAVSPQQMAPMTLAAGSDERMPRANRLDDSRPRANRLDDSGVTVSFTAKSTRERLQTVALSEDDLEELRVSRADSPVVSSVPLVPQPPILPHHPKPSTKPPPLNIARTSTPSITSSPVVAPITQVESNKTQQLAAVDIEMVSGEHKSVEKHEAKGTISEPMSVPEIDLNELADRAESSGEIEVAVEVVEPPKPPVPMRAQTAPPLPIAPQAENTKPKIVDGGHHSPPPVPAKAPPAPPLKKDPGRPSPSSVAAKVDAKAARGKPWFVDLFDEDYLRTLPFLTPQATQAEAEFVIEAMSLAPGAQVLDVGCGYGRHAMELAARGFHVVGLDLSTPLLVRGGEEAHRRGLTINFIRGDMRELDFENQFDAAYSLFSTFGYFDDETNKKTLQNIARALKPNGKVLIEILNRDYVIADLPTRVWWEGDGCVVLEEVELNYFSSRIQVNRSVVFDDGRQLEQEISVRAYSLHEVGKLMHAAGFRVLEVSGGYQMKGRFFGNQSRHIIVLAERKETPAP
jgi:SAM-dependent methyltransferase